MMLRSDWLVNDRGADERFYTKEETIDSVIENFDLRRYHSAEGYDIVINGITERCLVQTSSNPLRELNDFRKIHCPIIADVKRGYYVQYEGDTWIIDTNVVNVDGAYLSTRMSRCQYVLRWQNSNGDIVEKWAYASDQTKYSDGENSNSVITVGDNQYGLLLPIDADTKKLKRGMRFAFDFDDATEPDIYRLSNRKINLADGTIQLSFAFDAFNREKDKHIELNGKMVWICNYFSYTTQITPEVPDMTADFSAIISGNSKLKLGFSRTYTVTFKDKNGNDVDVDFKWDVVSDFDVDKNVNGNSIELCVKDEHYIGANFLLQVIGLNDKLITEIKINVIDSF